MLFDLRLKNPWIRAVLLLCWLTVCLLLAVAVSFHFIVRSLTDLRAPANRSALEVAASFFPSSARLNARLGETELTLTEDHIAALRRADVYAARAIAHAPFEYRHRLLQASVREGLGDRDGAEQALREAVRLAPGNIDARWRLANLLVRNGRTDQALAEFRTVTTAQPALLPNALALLWQISDGSLDTLKAVAGSEARAQLTLAQFLLDRAQPEAAVAIFRQTDPRSRLAADAPGSAFISALLQAGEIEKAWQCWRETVAPQCAGPICAGGFEDDFPPAFAQFTWQLGSSEYARVAISSDIARTGGRALRIDFTGRDTTRLGQEVRHMLVLRPGATYRLGAYVRTKNLITPAGPRLAIVSPTGTLAESAPVAAGTGDWQQIGLAFTAPAGTLHLIVRREPQFAWDEPTRGTLWLDDVQITETAKAGN